MIGLTDAGAKGSVDLGGLVQSLIAASGPEGQVRFSAMWNEIYLWGHSTHKPGGLGLW